MEGYAPRTSSPPPPPPRSLRSLCQATLSDTDLEASIDLTHDPGKEPGVDLLSHRISGKDRILWRQRYPKRLAASRNGPLGQDLRTLYG